MVLAKQPANAKALYRLAQARMPLPCRCLYPSHKVVYRLAQAHDGARDPRAALKALTALLRADPQVRLGMVVHPLPA